MYKLSFNFNHNCVGTIICSTYEALLNQLEVYYSVYSTITGFKFELL